MITRADIEAAEQAVIELQEAASHPTADLAGDATAEPAASSFSAPASPSGAAALVPSGQGNEGRRNRAVRLDYAAPHSLDVSLEAEAAMHLKLAAEFVRAGRRWLAREEIKRAVAKLNEAEVED